MPLCEDVVRRLVAHLVGIVSVVLGTVAVVVAAGPAAADTPVTPGDITGYGFDQCLAPEQWQMNRWMNHSPFLAAGIYISGDSRGCRNQPNLTPSWVSHQTSRGWRLLPITLGPQAACNPTFPRYGDDEVIDDNPGRHRRYRAAREQGRAEAEKTVGVARRLGIASRSTLWYDLEAFDATKTDCRESALAFLSAWTNRLHRLDYVSGVYSSAASGIKMLDDVRVERPGAYALPDQIWIARWDGVANTSTSYIRPDGWLPGGRLKQYEGGHNETWGGVTIPIDRNYLDLGRGSSAAPETHCGGVRIGFRDYPRLSPGADHPDLVRSLQCLLTESGFYSGPVNGTFGPDTVAAARAWQTDAGFTASDTWRRRHWIALLVDGRLGALKWGSAGPAVRRVQRALNAALSPRVPMSGVFDDDTQAAVRAYQAAVGVSESGMVDPRTRRALHRGRN